MAYWSRVAVTRTISMNGRVYVTLTLMLTFYADWTLLEMSRLSMTGIV